MEVAHDPRGPWGLGSVPGSQRGRHHGLPLSLGRLQGTEGRPGHGRGPLLRSQHPLRVQHGLVGGLARSGMLSARRVLWDVAKCVGAGLGFFKPSHRRTSGIAGCARRPQGSWCVRCIRGRPWVRRQGRHTHAGPAVGGMPGPSGRVPGRSRVQVGGLVTHMVAAGS